MPNVKISLRQLTIITALFMIGTAILIVPSALAVKAKQDAWIAALIGIGIGSLILALQLLLSRLYPDMNLVQISEKLLGKWLGKSVCFLLLLILFLGGPVAVLQEIGTFLTVQIMPETPIQAIIILFGAIVLMGVRLGLEVLARSAELLFPWFLLLFLSLSILLFSQVKWENALPILEQGPGPLIPAVCSFISIVYLPNMILLMIFPASVNRQSEANKAVFIGSLIGSLILLLIVILSILVLGPTITEKTMYPSYLLAQKINIGNFLQRIEVIMAVMWFITLFFRISFYFYATVAGYCQIFNIKNIQPLVIPLGWILTTLAVFIYPNVMFEHNWEARTWTPFSFIFGLLFPLLLLGLHGIRKIRSKGAPKKSRFPE
ncbi:spore germination protein KB [Fontibacillus phaseoli]|uniref:Spore germination protein KB n=1 Tax=Fontibacillus phaseoli TaxID=1416533 RepID=A0A369B0S4_9BACL|nr:endospore germination permease [Fontibacillus phaseoli]RCX13284.1 spore germination protein KB [Fontibacillus phaseoli]